MCSLPMTYDTYSNETRKKKSPDNLGNGHLGTEIWQTDCTTPLHFVTIIVNPNRHPPRYPSSHRHTPGRHLPQVPCRGRHNLDHYLPPAQEHRAISIVIHKLHESRGKGAENDRPFPTSPKISRRPIQYHMNSAPWGHFCVRRTQTRMKCQLSLGRT